MLCMDCPNSCLGWDFGVWDGGGGSFENPVLGMSLAPACLFNFFHFVSFFHLHQRWGVSVWVGRLGLGCLRHWPPFCAFLHAPGILG